MRLHLDLNVNGIRLLECQPVALLPLLWPPCWPSPSFWAWRKRAWSADPHVIGFCQSLVLLVGVGGSVLLLLRLLRQAWRPWLVVSLPPLSG
jgi:hypothetical protein